MKIHDVIMILSEQSGNKIEFETRSMKGDEFLALFDKKPQKNTIKMSKNDALNAYLELRNRIDQRIKKIAQSQDTQAFEIPSTINSL